MNQPTKIPGIEEKRIGDELYLHGNGGETLSVLNATAMMIWSMCDGMHTPEEMAAILSEIQDAPTPDLLLHDIEACLADLVHKGLVRFRTDATT